MIFLCLLIVMFKVWHLKATKNGILFCFIGVFLVVWFLRLSQIILFAKNATCVALTLFVAFIYLQFGLCHVQSSQKQHETVSLIFFCLNVLVKNILSPILVILHCCMNRLHSEFVVLFVQLHFMQFQTHKNEMSNMFLLIWFANDDCSILGHYSNSSIQQQLLLNSTT